MKTRKFTSVILAACLLVAATLPAGAANVATESAALSEYAGSTVKCQLVKFSDEGATESVMIDVPIPAGATKAQEKAIVSSAIAEETAPVTGAVAPLSLPSSRGIMDSISVVNNVTLRSTGFTQVGSGTVPYADAIMLLVVFNNYLNYGADTVTVTVTGGKYPNNSYTMTADIESVSNVIAYMYTGDGSVFLTNGSSISAKAKTNAATLTAQTCEISVSSFDLNGG